MQTTRSGRTVKPTKAGAAYQNEIKEKRQRTEAKNKSTLSRVKKDVTKLAELQKVDQTVLSSNLTGVKEEVNNEQEENGLHMVVPPSPEPDVKDAMHEILENVVANEPNVKVIPFNQQGEYGEQIRNLTTFLNEVKVRTGVERLMIGDKTLEDMDHGGSAEYVKQKNGECDFLFDRFETLFYMIKEVKTSNTINLLNLDFFNLQDETQMNLHTILILLKGDYDIVSGNLNYYKYIFYAFYWNIHYNCYFKIDMCDTEIFNLDILKRFNDIFETYSITLPATMNNITTSVAENQIITKLPYEKDHMKTFLQSCKYISLQDKEIKFKELLYYMPFSPNMPDPELINACRTPRRMIQSNVISFYLDYLRIKYSQYLKDVYVSDMMINFDTPENRVQMLKRAKFTEIPPDILRYKFVLIYFYSGKHFSLFILQKEDNGRIQPYHLDSMESGHTEHEFIQYYLNTMQTVINSQYSNEQSKKPSNIVRDKIIPNTIKQDDGTNNCGLYVLDYMEEVFKAVSSDNFSIDTIVSRINDKTANNKRANIYDLYEQTKSSKLTKIVAQQPINLIGTPRYDEGSLLFDIVPLDLGTQEQDYTPPQEEEEEERSPVVEDIRSTEEWVENEERKIKGIPPEFVEENETPPIIRKSTPQSRKDVPKKKSPPPKKHKSTSQSRKGVPSKANSKSTSRSQSDVQTSSSSSDDDDDYNSKKETRHREQLQVEFLPVVPTLRVDNNKHGYGQNAKIQEEVAIIQKVLKIDFSEEGYRIEEISSDLYYNKLKAYIIKEVKQSIKDAKENKIEDTFLLIDDELKEENNTRTLKEIIEMIIDRLK